VVAALGNLDVGRGFGRGEEPRGGFIIKIRRQVESCAMPRVAAESSLTLAMVAFGPSLKGFMGPGLRFLTGSSLGHLAAENVERRHRDGSLQTRRLQNCFQLAGADYGVHFRDALADFVAVALDEAAGDDEFFRPPRGLVAGHFQDGVDGLLFGRVDEAAGVDDEDFGFLRMGGEAGSCTVEQTHHHLGVDEVLGAAQGNKAHGG